MVKQDKKSLQGKTIYIATDSNGRSFPYYTFLEAKEFIKISNLNQVFESSERIGDVWYFVGINQEDSTIQKRILK